MKDIKWNPTKSKRLKQTRGASFEEIVKSKFIVIREHPNRNDQKVMVFEHKNYLWAVPFIEDEDTIFLKTIYRSRKLMKIYNREREDTNEKN